MNLCTVLLECCLRLIFFSEIKNLTEQISKIQPSFKDYPARPQNNRSGKKAKYKGEKG